MYSIMHTYLYTMNKIMAKNKQTKEIEAPTYVTADNATLCSSDIPCVEKIIYVIHKVDTIYNL